MIKIGIAFVLAGVMGSGADFLIRRYLNVLGSVERKKKLRIRKEKIP